MLFAGLRLHFPLKIQISLEGIGTMLFTRVIHILVERPITQFLLSLVLARRTVPSQSQFS
jgi:hypothetical protein